MTTAGGVAIDRTAAATAGVLGLADHLQTEEVEKSAIALDVLTIVTSFLNAGMAVKAVIPVGEVPKRIGTLVMH